MRAAAVSFKYTGEKKGMAQFAVDTPSRAVVDRLDDKHIAVPDALDRTYLVFTLPEFPFLMGTQGHIQNGDALRKLGP